MHSLQIMQCTHSYAKLKKADFLTSVKFKAITSDRCKYFVATLA